MVLSRRSDTSIWIAVSSDPALQALDDETMREYLTSRNLEDLGGVDVATGVLKRTCEKITLFRVRSLLKDHEHLKDLPGPAAEREIVKHHVIDARNVDKWRPPAGGPVDGNIIDEIPLNAISEISQVVIDMSNGSNGDTVGFTQPPSWRRERMKSRSLPAVIAMIDAVSELSLSSDETSTTSSV